MPAIRPIKCPATSELGGRLSGLKKMYVRPWFEERKALRPVTVIDRSTLGSAWIAWLTLSWSDCICCGEEPSCAMNTPFTTPLSPGGRKVLGTTMKSTMVPARQTAQMDAEIQRRRKNQSSDRP